MTSPSPSIHNKGFQLAPLRHALWWHSTYQLRAFVWRLNRRLRKTVTVQTKQGLFTIYCQDIYVGRDLFCYREWELDLAWRVQQVLMHLNKFAPKGTILDVGANIGVTAVGELYNGRAQRAIAIEPERNNYRLLQHNVRQNHFESSVICLPCAISDTPAQEELELSRNNLGNHRVRAAEAFHEPGRAVIHVQAEPLDRIVRNLPSQFADTISLIWIDVEGYEGKAFLGGKELFKRDIPVVAEVNPFELGHAGTRRTEFCAILERFWSSYWVTRQGKFVRYPISEFGSLWDELAATNTLGNVILCK